VTDPIGHFTLHHTAGLLIHFLQRKVLDRLHGKGCEVGSILNAANGGPAILRVNGDEIADANLLTIASAEPRVVSRDRPAVI
jgi:hypothetical protein